MCIVCIKLAVRCTIFIRIYNVFIEEVGRYVMLPHMHTLCTNTMYTIIELMFIDREGLVIFSL